MTGCNLTLLHAPGRRLAKRVGADGAVDGYEGARLFDMTVRPLSGLDELAEALAWLLPRPAYAVVRGGIADPARVLRVRRLVHPCPHTGEVPTLAEAQRRWLALDVDGLPLPPGGDVQDLAGCGAHARASLPGAFHAARCIVAASGSHGVKPGMRLRLWFWLSSPLAGPDCRRWLRAAPVDPALFSAAQLTYTAAPVFAGGVVDPLPCRLIRLPGAEAVVPPSFLMHRTPRVRGLYMPQDSNAGVYALVALMGTASRLASAREGDRHPNLLAGARSLARMVEAGLLGAGDVRRTLARAAEQCGLPEEEADAVIGWALAHPSKAALPKVSA